jgi:hypothetical protein
MELQSRWREEWRRNVNVYQGHNVKGMEDGIIIEIAVFMHYVLQENEEIRHQK